MLSEGGRVWLATGRMRLLSLGATVVLTALFPVIAGHFGLTLLDAAAARLTATLPPAPPQPPAALAWLSR